MRPIAHAALLLAALFAATHRLSAQAPANVTGHWEGIIQAPGLDVSVEIDVADTGHELVGTFGQPAQRLKGLPLTNLAVEGRSVTFQIKGGTNGQRVFKGDLSADGKVIAGEYASQLGTLPFRVTRIGDARIEPVAKSAAIAKALEGVWDGTLEVDGGLHLRLRLANQPDGTSAGSIVNVAEAVEIPLSAITQTASGVGFDLKPVGGSYSGALNPEGTALVGTLTQGQLVAPLTFRRVPSATDKR